MTQKNLLLIDSDEKSRKVLENSLKKMGLNVTCTASAESAKKLVKELSLSVIICESELSGMNGYKFCDWVKSQLDFKDVVFFLTSNDDSVESKVRGLKLGVDEYMVKPVFAKDLCVRVQTHIQRREQKDAVESKESTTTFSGNLGDLGIVDLIQTVEVGKKQGAIKLERASQKASLFFNDGEMMDAETSKKSGEEAFFNIMTWTEGAFEVTFYETNKKNKINKTTQELLMEGLRRLDEWNELQVDFPNLGSTLGIVYDALFDKLAGLPDELNSLLRMFDGDRTTIEVLDDGDADDIETLENIVLLYQEGLLEEVTVSQSNTHSLQVSQMQPLLDEMKNDATVDVDDDSVIAAEAAPVNQEQEDPKRTRKSTKKIISIATPKDNDSKTVLEEDNDSDKRANANVVVSPLSRAKRKTNTTKGKNLIKRKERKTLPPPPPVARLVGQEKAKASNKELEQPQGGVFAKVKLEKKEQRPLVVEEVDRRSDEKSEPSDYGEEHNDVLDERTVPNQLSLFSESSVEPIKTARNAPNETDVPLASPLIPLSLVSTEEKEAKGKPMSSHVKRKPIAETVPAQDEDEKIERRSSIHAATTPAPLELDYAPHSNKGTYALVAVSIAAAALLYFGFRGSSDALVAEPTHPAEQAIEEKPLVAKQEVGAAVENAIVKQPTSTPTKKTEDDEEIAPTKDSPIENKPQVKEALTQQTPVAPVVVPPPASSKVETHADLLSKAKKLRRSNKSEALKTINKALDKKKSVSGQLFKAELLMSMGKNREALQILLPMTQKNIGKSKSWYLRGNAHKKMGQRSQAQQAYAKCLMMSPSGSFASKAKKALASL